VAVVRGQGCLRGAIRAALNFWPTFSFKRKGGKDCIRELIEKIKKVQSSDAETSSA